MEAIMAIWNLFNKKKDDSSKEQEKKATPSAAQEKPASAPAKDSKAATTPATTKVAPAKPAAPKAQAAAPTSTAPKSTTKVAPAKAPAGVAPAAKPATKSAAAPAAKPAAKSAAPAAVKLSSEPAKSPARSVAGRPFFATTEEDIRVAFDAAIEEAEAQILKNGTKAIGKYEFSLEVDGYHFCLIANNGQILFDSPSFTTLLGALNGIKTFKKTVSASEFDVKVDKYGRYRFILANKYYGENYTTKEQCQKAADSVRNFANNSRIIRYKPDKDALAAYELAKVTKKGVDDVDWNAIARAEAAATKKGKFEICQEKGEYCFYLLASNGQILYASRFYANEAACRKGVDSFKRAVYVGNFFVDRDKFGNYRYVLKNIGSAPSFIGESYDNKPQCEKIIESVKNFIVTASIELESTEAE